VLDDPRVRDALVRLFSAKGDRFDELLVAARLNPKRDLAGANLRGANFAGAVLDGWDLTGCDLTDASFVGAKVRGLITDGAIGLDLTGAERLEDGISSDQGAPESKGFDWICEQIGLHSTGAARWPYILELLNNYSDDERAWTFLLDVQLKRERVGRHVSQIIRAWEMKPQRSIAEGNKLRFDLLRPWSKGGTPYVTVRARILRELSSALGATDEIFQLLVQMIQQEGSWTSGELAISLLANLYPTQERAIGVLLPALRDQHPFNKSVVVGALLEGFDSAHIRQKIRDSIVDSEISWYRRAGILEAYCRRCRDDAATWEFARQVFQQSSEQSLRAAILGARHRYGDLAAPNAMDTLHSVAIEDRDADVRAAAIRALRSFGSHQIEFICKRAGLDPDGAVRVAAVQAARALGHPERQWYERIFQDDGDDRVRGEALNWFLNDGRTIDQIRPLIEGELRREEPRLTAARAASLALDRWRNDRQICELVAGMLSKLPLNTGGWHQRLRSELQRNGYNEV
jgi:hypothetical protein